MFCFYCSNDASFEIGPVDGFRHADPVKVVGPVFAVDVDINDDNDGRRVENEELD